MRKKVQSAYETDQVVVLRRSWEGARMWCDDCGTLVPVVTASQAAAITNQCLRAICRQVEAGLFHFTETLKGQLYICLDSLVARAEPETPPHAPAPQLSTSKEEPDS